MSHEKVSDTTLNSNPPSQKKKRRRRRKKEGEGENVQNTKEHNQTNSLANFLFSKDNISSNWKNFKQNVSEKESSKEGKKKHNAFRNSGPHKNTKHATSTTNSEDTIKAANPLKGKHFKSGSKEETKVVAIDCEMVGVDTGKDNMLARVSLVNKYGNCIYDKYVLPKEPVVDYRTHVSGIRPRDLHGGEPFETVQKEVAKILQGKILVGHALRNDLKVLYLNHPRRAIRDTSMYKRFRKITNGNTPSLRKLSEELLGVKIQQGEHDSVIDARAAMQLYILYRKEWEKDVHSRPFHRKPK